MISVDTALTRIFALTNPLDFETVALTEAAGRVLAKPVSASRDQPPFAASAMDGYALRAAEVAPGAGFTVIGTAAAGRGFAGALGAGETVRIFTGAPLPQGADRVIIQEDVQRDGDRISLNDALDAGPYVRAAGADFRVGETVAAPRRLHPADLALLAAMNIAEVPVSRRPVVALIATGDELVMPGEVPGPDQIIASNSVGLAAMVAAEGGLPRILPIARDNPASLKTAFDLARGADLIVTIGGASVGDHDLVAPVAAELGMEQSFYKVAMRPGKPLMAGRLAGSMMLSLPGNPVSSMVCGTIFMLPALRAMQGLAAIAAPRLQARLAAPLAANGKREHYMRARLKDGAIAAFERQDSALLRVLSEANALLVRRVADPPRAAGDLVDYIPL